jgi:trehalose/maltose transport system substrate-binding protein
MNEMVRPGATTAGIGRRAFIRLGALGAGATLLAACGDGNGIGGGAGGASTPALPGAPAVSNAAAAKKYTGTTVVTDIPGFGTELATTEQLAKKFEAETGIKMKTVPLPKSTSDAYAADQRLLGAGQATPDVLLVDLIYPPALAGFLLDLEGRLTDAEIALSYPNLIAVNTIDSRLVAYPWYGGFGRLYYRTDLFQKYGYTDPPKTWTELTAMATKIQAGERAGNKAFAGYVFQGNAYEGLTCNALEWVASYHGGTFIDGQTVSIDNPNAIAALKLAQSWIGKIAPSGVTTFTEEEAHSAFGAGNAAFMRNWEYAQDLDKGSAVAGKFAVAPLPAGDVAGGTTAAAAGGWAVAVNKNSKNPDAAVEWLRYLTSPDAQAYRAVNSADVPAQPGVAELPEVQAALPALKQKVVPFARPTQIGGKYNEASTIIFQAVNAMLRGADVESGVRKLAGDLRGLIG